MKKAELLSTLEKYGIAPAKSRGQNFLIDNNLLDAMCRSMDIQAGETILEVGPGAGVLTREMLKLGGIVHAVEFDFAIQRYLSENLEHEKFTLHKGDACKVDYKEILDLPREFRCLANLPYAISSIFIAIMSELESPPLEMYFLLQREMAERLAADNSTKNYGSLTVRVQALYDVNILRIVPPEVFFPPPKVQSAFVTLKLKENPPSPKVLKKLNSIVRAAFSQRRKVAFKLMKGTAGPKLEEAYETVGLDRKARAEQITIEQYIQLAETLLA
ncbi:Dimethyladenosine transferase [Lentisphaera araneosa HTCC2155]|jgi:16S rRNA (adenine1518-N6/adenine1519-N6)-dimethyltransferase|uniref:Ribosomal RNA small subunit methyltransferase A n=1 Tax=Lentisphaera araneosa HTCC2155 TaxID=313628 RepID=A6DRB2_9BACT|nr:16S rRNA (adenine(1518)-N(6)/adenine(1519)-N(6))-dimethyltransferase RsmA [Lentisphaera araneosa]EDM25859.1 Dimethyladenosine transferase [Lentisphaera araneosa HTCC2155]